MTRISEILKNSTATKIKGHLKDEKGYCALGVLGCNAGILKDSFYGVGINLYKPILEVYGVPEDMVNVNFKQELDFYIMDENSSFEFKPVNIYELIYGLNDCTEMSFKEIGEFLETNLGL